MADSAGSVGRRPIAVAFAIAVVIGAIGVFGPRVDRSVASSTAGPPGTTGLIDQASTGPSALPAASTSGDSGPTAVTAPPVISGRSDFSDAYVSVAVRLESGATVEPGGTLTIDVTLANHSTTTILIGSCSPAGMTAYVRPPTEPEGRRWSGVAGELKAYAHGASGAGGGAVGGANWIDAELVGPAACDQTLLRPGTSMSGELRWTAWVVNPLTGEPPDPGVGAPQGDVPYALQLEYLPLPGGLTSRHTITIPGTVTVAGGRRLISAFQAVDALLADSRFRRWLSAESSSTWSQMNLFLENAGRAEGIVPAGPSWEIDLFRERGVPRNFAIGFVNAYTGTVRSISFCNAPCDR